MERAVPVLPADDLSVAKDFYRKLGFHITFESSEDGKTGIMGVERGTISLTIDAPMSGHGRDACVSLHVDDADRYYEEWRDRVDIPKPPKDEYWGRAHVWVRRSLRQHRVCHRPTEGALVARSYQELFEWPGRDVFVALKR